VFDGFSDAARQVVPTAAVEADRLGHSRIGTEHLLLGLLAPGSGRAGEALADAGVTPTAARHKVGEAVGSEARGPAGTGPGELPLTARAERALVRAGRFSRQARAPEVEPEHVLLGVLDVEGLACQVLRGLGADIGRLREALEGASAVPEPHAAPHAAPSATGSPPSEPPAFEPRCSCCGSLLADTLVRVTVPSRATTDGREGAVDVVFCEACGATLGVLEPRGQGDSQG
jgi:ATP-dependent Clp protease ATP-binding subunit ClpA